MPMNKTTTFGFPKPALGDEGSTLLTEYNELLDAADVFIKETIDDAAGADSLVVQVFS